jgi:hypothetical protein
LPAESFHHHEHVRVAWLYLQRYSVLAALDRFSTGLKRFAAAHGQAGLYHETITWAYVFLINERMQRDGGEHRWDEFVAQNGDVLNWRPNILTEYYDEQTLQSEVARKVFVMPDKGREGTKEVMGDKQSLAGEVDAH